MAGWPGVGGVCWCTARRQPPDRRTYVLDMSADPTRQLDPNGVLDGMAAEHRVFDCGSERRRDHHACQHSLIQVTYQLFDGEGLAEQVHAGVERAVVHHGVAGEAGGIDDAQIGPALQMAVVFQVVLFAVDGMRRVSASEGMFVSPECGAAFIAAERLRDEGFLKESDKVVVFATGAIALADISEMLSPGKHTITLKMTQGAEMPFSVAVRYNTLKPPTSPERATSRSRSLSRAKSPEKRESFERDAGGGLAPLRGLPSNSGIPRKSHPRLSGIVWKLGFLVRA